MAKKWITLLSIVLYKDAVYQHFLPTRKLVWKVANGTLMVSKSVFSLSKMVAVFTLLKVPEKH